ncbi:IucA/IucC family C-terminal-domain containing protein [Paenibacillus sp. FA6]|uniref:IucA/IucC family C-terminal-domain containing protein n=1 Tax=Paenibacillus sp. FA6 TaxID=3413029 RepID=UPI003F65F7E3
MDRLFKLKAFDVYPDDGMSTELARITGLLNEGTSELYLHEHMVLINAPDLRVTASMFIKRYAYLVVSSTLYSMVEFNSALHIPVSACGLNKEQKLVIQVSACEWRDPNGVKRDEWRENVLRELFTTHITPMILILNRVTGISLAILWENVVIRINSIYRKMSKNELDEVKLERLESDFYFLKHANGNMFHLEKNPLTRYMKLSEEQKRNPYRKTCCLYFKLEEAAEGSCYCDNCPYRRNMTKNEELTS